eukprot:TRINITY_DN2821_c0_g1_i1.p1 TRINITY_DN2821_c0_g1~~TRINITY_DN2821_c0_g1_i1.p1  ORF type:complete len:499 (+),score=91.73 TRINITY_DN2821_c0_g1_i1:240-1736(+)
MKGSSRASQRWENTRVQFQEPFYKMPKSSLDLPSGSWKPSSSLWEKEYCESAGVSWDQVCNNSHELEGFEHILRWDDSGALEAFKMAKRRYWAHCNGLSCDIPLPGPDLYIQEIDWSYRPQADIEVPERHHSSSEERKRPYSRRRYRGRRKSLNRAVAECIAKPDWTMHQHQTDKFHTGNGNNGNNIRMDGTNQFHSESKVCMDRREHNMDDAKTNKRFPQREDKNVTGTGWQDPNDISWEPGPANTPGLEVYETNNTGRPGWDQKEDTGWDSVDVHDVNALGNGLTEPYTSGQNQAKPMKESTLTTRRDLAGFGKAVGAVFCQGEQNQNEVNGAVASVQAYYKGNSHALGKRDESKTSWSTRSHYRENSTDVRGNANCSMGVLWGPPLISQDQYTLNQWGNSIPAYTHSYQKNYPFVPAQWRSAAVLPPQWHLQQTPWGPGSIEPNYQCDGNWVGQSIHSFPHGLQTWNQQPIYPHTIWHSTNCKQGDYAFQCGVRR